MKRYNKLYYNICNIDNIRYIYEEKVKKNTRNKKKIVSFDNYYMENLFYIKYVLSRKLYIPGVYNIFLITRPKVRVVMSQSIYDKVINHLVSYYILKPVILPCLIDSNVATIENKGTSYGIKLFRKYLIYNKCKYNNFYILKFDISKYFYSIDHNILKELLKRKIKDRDSLDIIFKIIDSTNRNYINNDIGKLINYYKNKISDRSIIKQLEDIPLYMCGKGLPIGNMTSQILAIFYLNDLDHYIKEKLGIKCYIRYMDDGVLIHYDKSYLKYCLNKINNICINKYKLKLNNKTKIYNICEGIDFLGYRYFFKNNRLIVRVRNINKRNFKRKIKLYRYDYYKYTNILGSYKGYFKYASSKNLWYEVVKKV